MYRYFLGAFGNKSFIRPQYEIMEDGKLRGIEDRWGEFPNGGTVSLTGISDSDTESIKNRLLQFKIDFNRDLHPGYAPYTDNSNKYQIPFNAIDDFDKDEVVEIIDIDYAIEDFINDKTKRTIRIKHRPNKQILLRYAQDCYGPFEFMISDIEDSYGDESYYTIKVFVNSGTINRYRNSDIEKIIMDGYFSIRRNDRIEFIYNISDLKVIEPEEKIEYIDNEELADFFKTLLNKSSEIDNLAGIREQFLKLADSFSEEGQLTDNRIKRICELLQTSVDLSDYKVRLTEEYFKNNEENANNIVEAPYLVLLDEANLSPIEFYWSNFNYYCDDPTHQVVSYSNGEKYEFGSELKFLATINYDQTTADLSPRFLDRAWVISMNPVSVDDIVSGLMDDSVVENNREVISLETLNNIFDWHNVKDKKMNQITKTRLDRIIDKMKEGGHTISARSIHLISHYYLVAEMFMSSKEVALDYAISQKILPCINGNGKQYKEFLNGLMTICKENQLNKSASIVSKILEKSEHEFYSFFSL